MASRTGKRIPLPPLDYLRQRLTLSSESPTGLLWAEGRNAGKAAGSLDSNNRLRLTIDGERYEIPRIVLSMSRGFTVGVDESVVFADGDATNADPENLSVKRDEEDDKTSLEEVTFEGVPLFALKVRGALLGRFNYREVAQACLRRLYENETDGAPIGRSVIAKGFLSADASRLHRETNQY